MIHEQDGIIGSPSILWEALVRYNSDEKRMTGRVPSHINMSDRLLMALGRTACMGYQEIGITSQPDGWHIHITACLEDGRVEILIPTDRNMPCQIIKDTRKDSEPYEQH